MLEESRSRQKRKALSELKSCPFALHKISQCSFGRAGWLKHPFPAGVRGRTCLAACSQLTGCQGKGQFMGAPLAAATEKICKQNSHLFLVKVSVSSEGLRWRKHWSSARLMSDYKITREIWKGQDTEQCALRMLKNLLSGQDTSLNYLNLLLQQHEKCLVFLWSPPHLVPEPSEWELTDTSKRLKIHFTWFLSPSSCRQTSEASWLLFHFCYRGAEGEERGCCCNATGVSHPYRTHPRAANPQESGPSFCHALQYLLNGLVHSMALAFAFHCFLQEGGEDLNNILPFSALLQLCAKLPKPRNEAGLKRGEKQPHSKHPQPPNLHSASALS